MSCLFDSVASFTQNCTSDHLRSMVADYIATNPVFWETMRFDEVFRLFPTEDVHYCRTVAEYIDHMRKPSTWGGALEIQCICNMFHIGVRIHTHPRPGSGVSGVPIEFIPTTDASSVPEMIVLDITWNGNHFEPIHQIIQHRNRTHSPPGRLPA